LPAENDALPVKHGGFWAHQRRMGRRALRDARSIGSSPVHGALLTNRRFIARRSAELSLHRTQHQMNSMLAAGRPVPVGG
jgi:hypothetical protein